MSMLAEITSGHQSLADVLFLIAAVLFVLEAITAFVPTVPAKVRLLALGLACVAVAWLVL